MTREALLNASISEFRDNKNNCLLYTTETYTTKSGYKYVIKKGKGESVSAAIHYNANLDVEDFIGRFESNDVTINTREKIELGSVLEYQGLLFSIVSQGNYNETMKQWHYQATGAVSFMQSQFFITSESQINEDIGFNSMQIWLSMSDAFGVPVLPSHYAVDSKSKFILVDIQESQSITPVVRTPDGIFQYRRDTVYFSFVNMTRTEELKALEALQEYSKMPNALYGLNSLPSLANEEFYQKSFNWKSLSHTGTFDVNYYLSAEDSEDFMVIKEAFISNITRI